MNLELMNRINGGIGHSFALSINLVIQTCPGALLARNRIRQAGVKFSNASLPAIIAHGKSQFV
nr:hypothetical protein [uncultured Cohaesibacter sp.]